VAVFYPCFRLVERGWCKLTDLKTLDMRTMTHGNEFLDSVLLAEIASER
jgi:hypothetical protein